MRMWMINPMLLCKKHLLGEHGELHKHWHCFVKQHDMSGRFSPVVQIEPLSMLRRHDELAKEMLRRNYKHNSPYIMPDVSYLEQFLHLKIDLGYNVQDLHARCEECRRRYDDFQNAIFWAHQTQNRKKKQTIERKERI